MNVDERVDECVCLDGTVAHATLHGVRARATEGAGQREGEDGTGPDGLPPLPTSGLPTYSTRTHNAHAVRSEGTEPTTDNGWTHGTDPQIQDGILRFVSFAVCVGD